MHNIAFLLDDGIHPWCFHPYPGYTEFQTLTIIGATPVKLADFLTGLFNDITGELKYIYQFGIIGDLSGMSKLYKYKFLRDIKSDSPNFKNRYFPDQTFDEALCVAMEMVLPFNLNHFYSLSIFYRLLFLTHNPKTSIKEIFDNGRRFSKNGFRGPEIYQLLKDIPEMILACSHASDPAPAAFQFFGTEQSIEQIVLGLEKNGALEISQDELWEFVDLLMEDPAVREYYDY